MSAALAPSLPSPLQLFAVVKPVYMHLMLGLLTLALFLATGEAKELSNEWQTPPAMDTFSSYEDMHNYFEHRNQRSLRHIENPFRDSYIEAFNHHNEQEMHRAKRSSAERKELPQPALIRFEMADAVEPSEEVKELIRQYKSRELQKNEKYLETVPPSNTKKQESFGKPIVKRAPVNNLRTFKNNNPSTKFKSLSYNKHLDRPKRSTTNQQPANFKVHYIPFQETDAREPDENTKMLIKRMRALEIEKLARDLPNPYPGSASALDSISLPTSTTRKPLMKRSKYNKNRKPKRSKRGAPEMIKFELSDAKDPDPSLKTFQKTKQTREAKDLKADKNPVADQEQSSDTKPNDQNAQASKRYFVYKDAPVKVKKSVSALPHDVQNIISHLIKGNNGGKAYVKYIPAQQMDYNNLKVAYQAPKGGQALYGHGGGGYGKYAPAQGKGEQVQVPVVEKVQYVYHPVVVGGGGGHGGGYEAGGGGHGGGYAAGGGYDGGGGGGGAAAGGEEGYGGGYAAEGGEAGYGVKYIAAGGGEAGYGGGYAGRGGHEAAGGGAGHGIKYVAVGGGGHGGGYAGGEAAAAHGGGGYAAAGDHGGGYALVHGAGLGAHANYGGYAGHSGGDGGHGGGGYAVGHGQAAVAIAHAIVVADAGGGKQAGYEGGGYANAGKQAGYEGGGYAGAGKQADFEEGGYALGGKQAGYEGGGYAGGGKQAGYEGDAYAGGSKQAGYEGGGYAGGGKQGGYGGGGYAEIEDAKNNGNEVIKDIPAPQLKEADPELYDTKYSVVPTVEQYAKTPTQEFKLKLYSPESLIAKAQLEAKDKAKAIEEQAKKAAAAAYGHAAAGGGKGYGGGGHAGGGGAKGYGGGGGEGYGGGGHGGGGAGPIIKIEYHAPADSYKGNYKEMPEFKQLSSLVGKSPEDQIHGLTYLLAKEMQNRLHLQRQHKGGGYGGGVEAGGYGGGDGYGGGSGEEGGEGRPQDNKAPILFHPDEGAVGHGGGRAGGVGGKGGGNHYQAIAAGKFIGMANSKQYIPVIEQAAAEEFKAGGGGGGKAGGAADGSGKNAAPHSYIAYGLSPNYKGISALKGGAPVAHQSGNSQDGNALHEAGYEAAAAKLQSYASKYAFGYRIRDFNTGNDFGHKQNRDLYGVTRGQYHILLPDGRIQNVIYHADDTGYHADVSFETGH